MGINQGDAAIIKTAGNTILKNSFDIIRNIALAVLVMGCEEIFVIGHTDCKMAKINTGDIISGLEKYKLSREILPAGDIREIFGAFNDETTNVRNTVAVIVNSPLIPKSIPVHGLMMNIFNGELKVVVKGEPLKESPGFTAPGRLAVSGDFGKLQISSYDVSFQTATGLDVAMGKMEIDSAALALPVIGGTLAAVDPFAELNKNLEQIRQIADSSKDNLEKLVISAGEGVAPKAEMPAVQPTSSQQGKRERPSSLKKMAKEKIEEVLNLPTEQGVALKEKVQSDIKKAISDTIAEIRDSSPVVDSMFEVKLKEVGANRLKVINTLQKLLNLDFNEAFNIVSESGRIVKKNVSKAEAQAVKDALEAVGAQIDINKKK